MYRIEFFNLSSQSWLSAKLDFDGCANFETRAAAEEWIAGYNDYERSDGLPLTSFAIRDC